MATCKECMHYDVCQYHIDEETKMTVNECGKFVNKADVVEVVRCKDCKYWHKKGFDPLIEHHIGECRCSQWENDYFSNETSDNDFCSCGERRDT